MSNMSYCRHENTAEDLQEVFDSWEEFDENDATVEELEGRKQIIWLAVAIADNYGMDEARRLEDIIWNKLNPDEEEEE